MKRSTLTIIVCAITFCSCASHMKAIAGGQPGGNAPAGNQQPGITENAENDVTSDSGIMTYDLAKGDNGRLLNPIRTIEAGNSFTICVKNANMLKYEVIITSKAFTYTTDTSNTNWNKLIPNAAPQLPVESPNKSTPLVSVAPPGKATSEDTIEENYYKLQKMLDAYPMLETLISRKSLIKKNAVSNAGSIIRDYYGIDKKAYINIAALPDSIWIAFNLMKTISTNKANTGNAEIQKYFSAVNTIGINSMIKIAKAEGDLFENIKTAQTDLYQTIQSSNDDDGIEICIELKNRADNTIAPLLPAYTIDIHRKFKSFMSYGAFVSGIYDNVYGMKDTVFQKQTIVGNNDSTKDTTVATNGKRVIDQTGTHISYGFCALYNWIYSCNPWLGIGANIGGSINVSDNITPQFLAGLSVAFGYQDKIIVSGGAALGKANRLPDPSMLTQPFEYNGSTVPIISKTQASFYFAITYAQGTKTYNTK